MFHREGRSRASPETFGKDLHSKRVNNLAWTKEGGGEETNRRTIVEESLVWGGPDYLVVIIGKTIHDEKR